LLGKDSSCICPLLKERRISVKTFSHEESRERDERYRTIFEYSAVSLWEEDISKLRLKLSEMKAVGINLRAHIDAHPQFIQEAIHLIEVTDVNQASVLLFEADTKEQLLGPLNIVLDSVSRTALAETILAIDEGKGDIESESSAITLNGRKLFLIVRTHIPPADAAYPSMLVSLIDITARKEAEQRELQSATMLRSIIDNSPDSIFVKDNSLRMVLCNTALAHAIGKEPQDTYGKSDLENGWSADLVKGNPEKGLAGWEKDDLAVLSGKTIEVEDEPSDFDKGIRVYHTVKFPLRGPDGAIIGLVGIGREVTAKRMAEAELREAKEFAENLINTANVMVLGLDLEGRVTIFNKAAEEITGYTRSEMMSRNWFKTVVPKERYPEVLGKFEKLAREGDVGGFESPIVTKAGQERYTSWNNNQIVEDGQVTGILSFGTDITDRRRMEQDLAWERALFELLMDNVPDFIYFKDSKSRFVRASMSFAHRLGLKDPSEMLGKTDADFFGTDQALIWLEDEQKIMQTGTPVLEVEEKQTFPGRPDAWDITTKIPLRDLEGNIVGTFGISHDITRRKLLEAKNQQLATLVDSADDAIVGLDLDLRVITWNRGAERLYGYSAQEMIGEVISILVPPEIEDETQILGDRLRRGEQISRFETIRLRKDGSKVLISLSLSPIRDREGRIAGTAAVGGDITEQKALQAQLNRMHRLESLATLASGVAHQFNNINTVIGSYLELIRSEKGLPPRLVSYAEAAIAGVQRSVGITSRLLVLTEPAGTQDTVRLDVLARTLLPLHEKRIKEEKVQIELDFAETPPIRVDESRLKFVLSSIIDNALDSLLDQPVRMVTVRTGSTTDSAFFEVKDSGCGISEDDLTRIFSPFSTMKGEWAPRGSPQAKLKGVGLSLAISSTTVSEYGGKIEVQSTKGAGSTFRVLLPFAR
jgi:PAS domain S-box-containing protein